MKKHITQIAATMVCAVAFSGFAAQPAEAQLNVNVNIGTPPPVVVHSAPTMVFLTEPGLYVATGIPYDVYFIGGRYYYFHGDNWFFASGYNGPWVYVVHESLPPGLRKFKVRELRTFRDREYQVYKVQGKNFKGKQFVAVAGQDNGNGNGRGKGKKR